MENGKIEHTFKSQTWATEKGKISVCYHDHRNKIVSKKPKAKPNTKLQKTSKQT